MVVLVCRFSKLDWELEARAWKQDYASFEASTSQQGDDEDWFQKKLFRKTIFVFNSMSFRDIRVVHSRSRPPKPPKPPKKHAEEARSQKFDQLDRLNAPLRPGPPYDDQVGQGSICKCQKYWFCNLVFVSFSIIPPCDNHRKTKNNFFVQFPKSFFSVL